MEKKYGRVGMPQSKLFESIESEELESRFDSHFPISESVRNVTYHEQIEPELAERQQIVYEIVLANSPEGISSPGIAKEMKERFEMDSTPDIHIFSGRLTELTNPKGKPHPYCNPPLIEVCGVEQHPDFKGRIRNYTKYRIRRAL